MPMPLERAKERIKEKEIGSQRTRAMTSPKGRKEKETERRERAPRVARRVTCRPSVLSQKMHLERIKLKGKQNPRTSRQEIVRLYFGWLTEGHHEVLLQHLLWGHIAF